MPSGATSIAVESGPGQLVPDERVGVVVGHPLRLAQDGSRRGLPVGPGVAVLRGREVERPLLGLQLGGLGEPAFDAAVNAHAAHLRRVRSRSLAECDFLDAGREVILNVTTICASHLVVRSKEVR